MSRHYNASSTYRKNERERDDKLDYDEASDTGARAAVGVNYADDTQAVLIAHKTKESIERLGINLSHDKEMPFSDNWKKYLAEKTPDKRWEIFLSAVLRNIHPDVHMEKSRHLTRHEKSYNNMTFSKTVQIIVQFYLKRIFGENCIITPSEFADVKQATDVVIVYESDKGDYFLSADLTTANRNTPEGERVLRQKARKIGLKIEIPEFGKKRQINRQLYVERHKLTHILIHIDRPLWENITKMIYNYVTQGKAFDPDNVLKNCAEKWLEDNNSSQINAIAEKGESALTKQLEFTIQKQLEAAA